MVLFNLSQSSHIEKNLDNVLEEIEEQFFTERDNLIQQLDFPERLLRNLSEGELKLLSNHTKEDKNDHIL